MSSTDLSFVVQNAARAVSASEQRPVLRIALYAGELARIPNARRHIHVLSGTAWISGNGKDRVAARGSCEGLHGGRRDVQLVSGLGPEPLLFEVW
jgi:hypothetical protein